jgi:secretion/DNA translocation related TadE-like protein
MSVVRRETGAGSVLVIALVGVVALLGLGAVALGGGLAARQRVIGAADAAALAAADAASGAVSGEPCVLAGDVAAANGAELRSCSVDAAVAVVEVGGVFGVVPLLARSRAGPPPSGAAR